MRTEDFIARCKLLSLLRTLPDRDLTSDERLQLISAFRLFVRQIAHRARTEESKLDLLRLYACLRTAFKYLKVHRSVPTKEQGYFLDAALSFLSGAVARDPNNKCNACGFQSSCSLSGKGGCGRD